MRYEPSVNERAVPRATRAGTAGPWAVSAPRVGDSDEARSHQTAELDIWEDEGGATSKHATRYPDRKVDSNVARPGRTAFPRAVTLTESECCPNQNLTNDETGPAVRIFCWRRANLT